MRIDFAKSERSTLGIEWELALVDHASGELAPAAPEILGAVELPDGLDNPHITAELLTNTVEIVTGVHRTVADGVADLMRTIDAVREVADPMGVELMCAGTHPFSQWFMQQVTDKERYQTLIDRTQWWGRQMMIWGVHVHVGIEDRDKIMPIMNGLLRWLPHFQSLSASSPFFAGEATGYASSRAMLFQQLPTAGLPPQFGAWANYEGMVDDMLHVGVIDHYNELRWDIRPSARWGTLEMRVSDGLATTQEVGAIAALTQCLVEELSTAIDRGEEIATMPSWFVRENKWRAARYGLDAIVIQDAAGNELPVRDDLRDMVVRLEPIAARLGCLDELAGITSILEKGASYQRQLRVAEATGGSLKAVVASLVKELRDGLR
ncbi:glutamate--cysteine ligase [Marisediminicola antarctica]|uniref:Putative glutamate--cysteine ligase 2 n=1 Tax=Marisediminicola antarctica TaxID=674079 RepID=A0A7L5AKR7_9MICO|nr:glutamate--cysteine ligase [Marisediminicola antarctica]QHO70672.1 glutamate--cysteine ligase [Marisediminicola antarctica]